MAKLPPKKEKGNDQEWLNTYADMVTLLLTFFVLLFASSNLDEAKLQYIFQAFQTRGKYVNTVVAQPNDSSDDQGGITDDANNGGGEGEMPQSYDELYQYLAEYIDANDLSSSVSIQNSEAYFILQFNSKVFFDGDSYWLKPEGRKLLDDVCPMLKAIEPQIRTLTVTGHTATAPSLMSDWTLSTERAASVLNYLDVEVNGSPKVLPRTKFSAEGYADTRPIAPNDTDENREKNRRVEIRLLKEDLDDTDPDVFQDILNHGYHADASPFDPNAKPNIDYENLPEGSADKIIGFIDDKFGGNGSSTVVGATGPGLVDGSQFIVSAESGSGADKSAADDGGEKSE